MKQCRVKLKSVSPMRQARYHNTPKEEKETHEDYEKRTWVNRLHVDDKDHVFIPS